MKPKDFSLQFGPTVDLSDQDFCIRPGGFTKVDLSLRPHFFQMVCVVALLHVCCLVTVLWWVNHAPSSKPLPLIDMELSFGFAVPPSASSGQTLHKTVSEQDLAQITKAAAPDLKQRDEMSTVHNEKITTTDDSPPAPKVQKLSAKEWAQRKMHDMAHKTKQAEHQTQVPTKHYSWNHLSPLNAPEVQKNHAYNALPVLPTGSLTGDKMAESSQYQVYSTYLAKQLRSHWLIGRGTLDKSLDNESFGVLIQFQVNPFGYLLGAPRIERSSGKSDFDDLALKALRSSFPVDAPPEELRGESFRAFFTLKDTFSQP